VLELAALGLTTLALSAAVSAATPAALTGDAARGAAIAGNRSQGLCVLCHAMPGTPAVLAGTIGPDLSGVGSRLSAQALRARLLEPERFNPQTVMPSYARRSGFERVAASRRDQPLLSEQQIEDVVAWLSSLK
jgi:L-cysteine S-thiosulfotransferase